MSLGLEQLVKELTHVAGHLFDGIFSECPHLSTSPDLPLVWSEHWAVMFNIKLALYIPDNKQPLSSRPSGKWHSTGSNELKVALMATWPQVTDDPDIAVRSYQLWLDKALDKIAPIKPNKSRTVLPSEPWFSQSLRFQKQACRRHERKWRLHYVKSEKEQNKRILAIYKDMIFKEKNICFTPKIEAAKNSSKELFATIKKLRSRLKKVNHDFNQTFGDSLAIFFQEKANSVFRLLSSNTLSYTGYHNGPQTKGNKYVTMLSTFSELSPD